MTSQQRKVMVGFVNEHFEKLRAGIQRAKRGQKARKYELDYYNGNEDEFPPEYRKLVKQLNGIVEKQNERIAKENARLDRQDQEIASHLYEARRSAIIQIEFAEDAEAAQKLLAHLPSCEDICKVGKV